MMIRSLLALAWRQSGRDLRSGELNLLAAALMLAIMVSTAVGLLANRLEKGLGRQVVAVLGADLVIQGSRPVPPAVAEKADALGLAQSRTLEFPSVIMAGEQLQMVSARGVAPGYPLRGMVHTTRRPLVEAGQPAQGIPASGEAWLEPRLFALLGIAIGDTVMLGEKSLRITRAITLESDRGKGFYSLSPRLMFNLDDLDQTRLIQPGSRVQWRYLYAGSDTAVAAFRLWLKQQLADDYRLLGVSDGHQGLSRVMTRVTGFLSLAAQLAILLSGIAIAMAAGRFAQRHGDGVAILRCLGASRRETWLLVGLQLVIMLSLVLPLALGLGWLLSAGALALLAELLPPWLPPADGEPVLFGALTGVIVLFGFALAPLLRLNGIAPAGLLQKAVTLPPPTASWRVYGLALASLVLLSWLVTDNLSLTLTITLAAAALLPLAGVGVALLLWLCTRLVARPQLALPWRTALRRMRQQRWLVVAQLLAFSLILMIMTVALTVRTDLLAYWQAQLPEQAPNYFSLNIQPSDLEPLAAFMARHKLTSSRMYPVVRGRLGAINGQPLAQVLDDEQLRNNAVNRELNLTWTDSLPEMNTLIAGRWWSAEHGNEVSVESGLAERLGLSLGDRLTFTLAGQSLTVTITSLRRVEWENFRPNFYMVMPASVLADFPASWLNSFYLPAQQRPLLNEMIRTFPSLTLIDMDAVIIQAQQIIQQGVLALEAVLVVLFIAGLLVLWASIAASQDERLIESALMEALGASSRQLQGLQTTEFLFLGALSGLLAALGSAVTTWLLFTRVMALPWSWNAQLWWLLPVLGALLLGFSGYLGTFRLVRRSALVLLRERG